MAIVVALNNKRQSRAGLSGVINYVSNDRKHFCKAVRN